MPLFFLSFLIFYLLGYVFLRKIVDQIIAISRTITERTKMDISDASYPFQAGDEIHDIIHSFKVLSEQVQKNLGELYKKVAEFSTLKELSDLCYATFDVEELFHITLERALKLVTMRR
nr:hypothetical protein [Desulfobacterales bacterium]